MKDDLSFSVSFRVRWANQRLKQTTAQGQVGGAQMHVRTPYCMLSKYLSYMHKNKTKTRELYADMHKRAIFFTTGIKGKGKIFHWFLGQPITVQVTSAVSPSQPIRTDYELTLLSYLAPYLLLWMYTHTHTFTYNREATSQHCLEADDRIIFLPTWSFDI